MHMSHPLYYKTNSYFQDTYIWSLSIADSSSSEAAEARSCFSSSLLLVWVRDSFLPSTSTQDSVVSEILANKAFHYTMYMSKLTLHFLVLRSVSHKDVLALWPKGIVLVILSFSVK